MNETGARFQVLAILYLVLAFLIGDRLTGRCLAFTSWPHRLAAGFLAGILVSTWFTYLAAVAFSGLENPLLWANLLFAVVAAGLLIFPRPPSLPSISGMRKWASGLTGPERWDLIFILVFFLAAAWIMFGTFGYSDGTLRIANHQWSDFGSTVSIMQSFAEGHNFPTQYPHFTGDRIRYHFLYYFQAGNLEYLGLNPALSNNLLSVLSMVSMLVLVMTLGRALFNSRAAGRIGAVFFFFHGTLSFIPFLIANGSNLIGKLAEMRDFVPSGMPYRGEDWGVWTQVVYANQRHLASSIGVLLIVLIHLAIRYRSRSGLDPIIEEPNNGSLLCRFAPFVIMGVLLGLLPLWNGAVFAAAVTVLGLCLLLFPSFWKEMIALAAAAGIVALPQVIYLKSGLVRPPEYSLLNWGYTLDDAGVLTVAYYIVFTFGFKWLLIAAAVVFSKGFQRRFLIAVSGLFILTFCFQFSDEVLANHKFLNIWLVIANVYAGFGVLALWRWSSGVLRAAARAAAAVCCAAVFFGGALDIFPLVNSYWVEMKYEGDPLVEWVRANTDERSVFLSHRYVNHRILLAGRRLFYGHPYYAWGAGHDTTGRDGVYKRMFGSTDIGEVFTLLKENNISYVAIDNAVRRDTFISPHNETLYARYLPLAFDDREAKYENLKIYRVPDELDAAKAVVASRPPAGEPQKAPSGLFAGSEGTAPGQISRPRGITVDGEGNIYIADTGNSRIQKFDADGKFVLQFGSAGDGEGTFRELNGVAVDAAGDVWAVDAGRHVLMRFDPSGAFLREWAWSFYGPRDLTFAPNGQLYIVDQGRTRIVRFDPRAERFTEWGSGGGGDGQFNEPTGLGAGEKLIAVADKGNGRVQLFDPDGRFVRQWKIDAWAGYAWNRPDVAIGPGGDVIYVTSGISSEVIAFDLNGARLDAIGPDDQRGYANPTSLAVFRSDKRSLLYTLNTGGEVGFSGPPSVSVTTLK